MSDEVTDLEALERFVVENDHLLDLEARIGKFNVFDALGIVNAEIRHSNFLAWLLDPGESHGLGGLFLNAVLMDLLRQTPVGQRLFSPIKLDGGELRGVEVRREWRNIDLLIKCDEPPFVIAIENKVGSGEHSGQLSRYHKIVSDAVDLAGRPHQFVYLTRDGDEPSEDAWTVYSYADLHRVLTRVRDAAAEQIGDEVATFLDHYLRLIGSRFMEDEKITELCRDIYKNHRHAIRLIIDRVGGEASPALETMIEVVEGDDRWTVLKRGGRSVEYLPTAWVDTIQAQSKSPKKPWIYFEFNLWDQDKCGMNACLRAAADPDQRSRCFTSWMKDPKRYGLKLRKKPLADDWNSLQRVTMVKWEEGGEVPVERVAAETKKQLDKLAVSAEELWSVIQDVGGDAA